MERYVIGIGVAVLLAGRFDRGMRMLAGVRTTPLLDAAAVIVLFVLSAIIDRLLFRRS